MSVIIRVKNNYYEQCVTFAKESWANEKQSSRYNNGFINSKDDPYKVTRIGAIGEMAFAIFMNLHPNFEYKKYGEKYDFEVNNYKIDVKTAKECPKYRATLLRCINERGKYIKPSCDIYVSAYIQKESREEKWCDVVLVGWHTKESINEQTPVPSRVKSASHWNYELKFDDANNIESLGEYLNGERN